LGIENLDHLILVIKNWPDDACVTHDGASKPMNMFDFLITNSNIIVENNKFIEERGLFEKDVDFDN
jgi:hypothetical protein